MRLFKNRIEDKLDKSRWSFWRWHDIRLDGKLYLTRLTLLTTPLFGIKLHKIHLPDSDRGLHTHPWSFISFILRGGYVELESKMPQTGSLKIKNINWFSYKNTITAHKIIRVKPKTLTLVLTGPKIKSWGYWNRKHFIDWQDYHAERDGVKNDINNRNRL